MAASIGRKRRGRGRPVREGSTKEERGRCTWNSSHAPPLMSREERGRSSSPGVEEGEKETRSGGHG
jgi:hypothetical protein